MVELATDGTLDGRTLKERVVGGHVTEVVYNSVRAKLARDGLIERGQTTRLTAVGRAVMAGAAA